MEGSVDDFGGNTKPPVDHPQLIRVDQEVEEKNCDTFSEAPQSGFIQWHTDNDKRVYRPCGHTADEISSGLYECELDRDGGAIFIKQTINIDDLIFFKDSIFDSVLQEIDKFWTLESNFIKYGFLHRRGFLFYGPPGSGKSALINQIISDVIKRNYVVINCNTKPIVISECLKQFRFVEPHRKIICLFEDIDAYIRRWDEDLLLSFLDGENQLNNILNIATTNYPENLDKRIVSRPRRFDSLVFIGMPSASIRKEYFTKKLKISEDEVDKWVRDSEGFSFASLAEAVISVKCLNNSYESTISKLKKLAITKITSEDWNDAKVGFGQQ